MCLAVPGKITQIDEATRLELRTATVDFGGVFREVSLAFLPEAKINDYVIVHVGVALSRINEAEAHQIFETLSQIDLQEELGENPPREIQ